MSDPVKPEKEKKKDDFEKEREASLGFISQLVRYAPTGGSVGLITSFILDNEVLKALLTFPFMVGAVAWAAYSKSFLLRIQEIMEARGKEDVDSLVAQWQKLDSAIKEAIKWQLAGTDDKYLKCQGSSCSDYETIGFNQSSGTFMPLLKDVFVPLELSDIFIKDCTGDEYPGLPGFNRYQAYSERGETTREEEYEFAHLSFQEFLAAKQIKETKQEQLLLDNWQEQWWRGTILLYAALVNPTSLIRDLIALNNEEATTLALRCLEETPRKIDPEIEAELTSLQSNVQNQLYQSLETYLKNGQWREADEETLKVMLQVADREEQGWLNVDSIENFPCEDLRIIDQLWVKYSKGKFGFSVQKDIYESLGGTKEYNREVWRNFCDRNGWRKGGKWLGYSELTFDDKAPQAHLPGKQEVYWSKEDSILLFSRAKTCNL